MPTIDELAGAIAIGQRSISHQIRDHFRALAEISHRLSSLPELYQTNPEQALAEVHALCDAEHALTGDCKATGPVADLLDPEGEYFERTRGGLTLTSTVWR